MLLQFNVTNYMSFKNEAILDLYADSDNSHDKSLIRYRKDRVLPAVAVYGANAAGKSNLFKALTPAIRLVRNSVNMQVDSAIPVVPFAMNEEGRSGKTRFDFIFVNNRIKYEYGFLADSVRVYEEYLYEYRSARPSMIFERENTNTYTYTAALRSTLKQYEEKTTDNKLFLATATAWNCKETENAYRWFAGEVDTYDRSTIETSMVNYLVSDKDGDIKDFAVRLLKEADFNITDYSFSYKKDRVDETTLPADFPINPKLLSSLEQIQWRLDMYHDFEHDGHKERIGLPYQMESNGTKLFFSYSPLIYHALKTGKTIIIDEIDNGLHPMLIQYLIGLFTNPEINPRGAQLIFNTHDVQLLDLEVLRRDQIYFVEKDRSTGMSELYSLSDFSPRKTDKIQKGYLLGRYGAIPNIGDFEW